MKYMEQFITTYTSIYGHSAKATKTLDALVEVIDHYKKNRISSLKELDQHQKNWFFKPNIVGMTFYVDLFADNMKTLMDKIDYFNELGITFIHLMPLLEPLEGENDGGYAVKNYQSIDPRLGTLEEFKLLLERFRKQGIYVSIDYVINHVAKEHEWAKKALEGDKVMQDMFIMYDTPDIPNQFNQTVPEVLPDKCPGNFTYYEEIKKYVFTSFSDYQWDLNFKNPEVLKGMIENMLFLANIGVNMIRLDAIPFMWKTLGTHCRNLPEIHDLIHMFHLVKEEVCPSVALLGEAIVEPYEIVKYFGDEKKIECEIMYNANLMVDIFNSFATKDVRLLIQDTNRYRVPSTGSWMNYVRCHDDIGWGFSEDIIRNLGFDPEAHKQFLISFYGGQFPGSFSNGEHYQFNPHTQDARTNGTLASLLGLEKAIANQDLFGIHTSINRIHLAHALILFYRGFPLIYSGDEIATLNDQTYKLDPNKKNDSRWVHRPKFDWKRAEKRHQSKTPEFEVFEMLKHLIKLRKTHPCFDGRAVQFAIDLQNKHVFALIKRYKEETYIGLFNFSECTESIRLDYLRQNCTSRHYENIINGRKIDFDQQELKLSPYEYIWAKPKH